MKKPKTFELLATQDDDDSFVVSAGPGCLWFSLAWLVMAMIAALAALLKVLH